MNLSLVRTARLALLLALGFVLGAAALSVANASSATGSLLQHFNFSSGNGPVVADASCDLPKDATDEVYFVSCGGFF